MLRSTFYSFTTALRGMNTAQKQLDVTGQNISNAGTVGYTRQRADVYSAAAAGIDDKYTSNINNSLAGQGSVIGGISQLRDQFLDVRFRRETASVGEETAKSSCMNDLELVFDEISSSGLMTSFSNFVSKLQSFASNANNTQFNSITRDAAGTLVNQLQQYSRQLGTVREQQEYQLKNVSVNKMNDILTNIAHLNDSIRSQELSGGNAPELKDERNLLLDELSSYVKTEVTYKDNKLTNGSAVQDITISMIGADGTSVPLVYNNAAAKFSAALPDAKDPTAPTEAVVTLDNSEIQAKTIFDPINDAIKNIVSLNNSITVNAASLQTNATDLTTAQADKAALVAAGVIATDPKMIAADAKITKLTNTKNTLTTNQTNLLQYRTDNVSSINTQLSSLGIKAVPADGDSDNATVGDYQITLQTLTNTPLLDGSGNPLTLVSGLNKTDMTKATLLQAGVTFKDTNVNKLNPTGSLKGSLEMLNSKGTFDYNSNAIRGIGYYENMLDSLANQFASKLNLLNSTYTTNADGTVTVTDSKPLFETTDGSTTITASNIKVAGDWLTGKYSLTTSKKPTTDSSSGANDNVLLMISACTTKSEYKTSSITNQDSYGNYLNKSGAIFANGVDASGNYTIKFADSTGVKYNPDGSKVTMTPNLPDFADNGDGTYTYTPTGVLLTKDSAGNYVQKVANKDFIDYKPDGSLDANVLNFTSNPDGTFTYGSDTLKINADGDYYNVSTNAKVANAAQIAYKPDGTLDATTSMDVRAGSFLYNGTFQEFLSNIANVLSLDVSSTSNLVQNKTTVLEDIQNSKDQISTVSIDEEGVNMMQYQKAYNAAARFMTTLDEAVDKIINGMGMVGR